MFTYSNICLSQDFVNCRVGEKTTPSTSVSTADPKCIHGMGHDADHQAQVIKTSAMSIANRQFIHVSEF